MERFNIDVSSFDGPLQDAPEVLDSVGVNMSFDIGFGMVNSFVGL